LSVHLSDLYSTSTQMLPWATFLIGLGGSIHCVGMCGGLSLACAPTTKSNISYQLGRLFGYSMLGLLSGLVGKYLIINQTHPYFGLVPAFLIGGLLIFWGIKNWKGTKAEIPLPKAFNQFIMKLWSKLVPRRGEKPKNTNALFVGLLSIFLPCGFLYGVVIALAAFQNPIIAAISMVTFWLGTVPAMSFAPEIIQRVFRPMARKLPNITSFLLITIGVLTISHRVYNLYTTGSCH
jgi:sulfite exporter TauE/SafE